MLATHQLTTTVTVVIVLYTLLLAVCLTVMWHIRPGGYDDRMAAGALEDVLPADEADAAGNEHLEAALAEDDPAVLVRADEPDGRVKGDGHQD